MGFLWKSKRQRRREAFNKWTKHDWKRILNDPNSDGHWIFKHDYFKKTQDAYGGMHIDPLAVAVQLETDEYRNTAIESFLDDAERRLGFAKRLDRLHGLRTDEEDDERHKHWATIRNQIHAVFTILAFGISTAALAISITTCARSP